MLFIANHLEDDSVPLVLMVWCGTSSHPHQRQVLGSLGISPLSIFRCQSTYGSRLPCSFRPSKMNSKPVLPHLRPNRYCYARDIIDDTRFLSPSSSCISILHLLLLQERVGYHLAAVHGRNNNQKGAAYHHETKRSRSFVAFVISDRLLNLIQHQIHQRIIPL